MLVFYEISGGFGEELQPPPKLSQSLMTLRGVMGSDPTAETLSKLWSSPKPVCEMRLWRG